MQIITCKVHRWVSVLCLLFFISPFLMGCWDRAELDERAVVLGIGIDVAEGKAEEKEPEVTHLQGKIPEPHKEMIQLTAQIGVPGRIPLGPETAGGGGGAELQPIWVVKVVGHTIDDAILNIQQQVAEPIFLGHLRVIVVHEEVAKRGIEDLNDYLRRNPEVRRTAWMLVSKDKAHKLLGTAPPLERVTTLYLPTLMEGATKLGKFPNDIIGFFWTIYSSKGQEPFLPYVTVGAAQNILVEGLAYFKGDAMVGVTKPLQIGAYMAAKGVRQGGYASFVKIPGTPNSVLISATSRRTKWEVDIKNGKPHFQISIHYELELEEKPYPRIQVNDEEIISNIEKAFVQSVKNSVNELIKTTQEKGADIFGFGEFVRAKKPFYWNEQVQSSEDWQELYKDITYDIKVTGRIRFVGMKAK